MLNIFGTINPPVDNAYFQAEKGDGLFMLLSNIFKLAGVIAGIFFLIQLILAGYSFISASGDPKKAEAAFATIWQSLIGLAIVSSAFVLAAFIGNILDIDILNPTIRP